MSLRSLIDISREPWQWAVAASALLHIAMLATAGLFAIGIRPEERPQLAACWLGPNDFEIAPQTIEVGQSKHQQSEEASNLRSAEGHFPSALAIQSSIAGPGPVRMRLQSPAHGSALSTNWFGDARTAVGLDEIVGTVVSNSGGLGGASVGGVGAGEGRTGDDSGPKASFFGIQPLGRRIVYVIDGSSSMNRPSSGEGVTRFGQMKIALADSILNLREDQQFFVIFFNEHANPMPASGPEFAIRQNQQKYLNWIVGVRATGLTDPRPALELALSLNPDVIFFLTDGSFPADVQGDLRQLRQRSVQINTIAFGDAAEKSLKPLAANNRGQFSLVP
jgi:hypothetical protein